MLSTRTRLAMPLGGRSRLVAAAATAVLLLCATTASYAATVDAPDAAGAVDAAAPDAATDTVASEEPQVTEASEQPQEPSVPTEEPAPEVNVAQGRMRGAVLTSRGGRRIYAFRGIPYAKPPVGELRFKEPLPAGPWEGVLDATLDGSECVQKNYLVPPYPVSGNEDCLFLNVFTPKRSPSIDRLPVLVYIHGGGFFAGSGASYFNGPQYLLDHDVVLVTLNYRLGALGFLSSGDARAPGNAGLKDQVMALRWIRENAAAFGGDPRLVTIMGQSAGGACVHLHMLSPLSRGLFQRAISQSGTALSAWARPVDPVPIARQQAEFLDCNVTTMDAALHCLRNADAYTLTETGHRFHFWSIDPLTVFRPVVEAARPGSFLLDEPATLMQMGDFAPVPWLTGSVPKEGLVRSIPILINASLTADLNARWNEVMPRLMELEHSAPPERVPILWRNISDFYFGNAQPPTSLEKIESFTNLYTDRAFFHGLRRAAELHARAGHRNIFLYEFAYRGRFSYSLLFGGGMADYGVSHCDDLLYLLYAPVLFPNMPEAGSGDATALDALTRLWVNFAKHGDPTPQREQPSSGTQTSRRATRGEVSASRRRSSTTTDASPEAPAEQKGDDCWSSVTDARWSPYEPSTRADDFELRFLRIEAAPAAPDQLRFCMRKGFYRRRVDFWRSLPIEENKMTSWERLLRPFFYLVGVIF